MFKALKLVFLWLLLGLNLTSQCAPIVDPNAPIQFRPSTIFIQSHNATVLNIPNPNAQGLSHLILNSDQSKT